MACSTESPRPAAIAAGELLGDRLGEPRGRLAGRAGEPGLGQLLGRGLVLVPLGALEADAELFQRVVQEHLLDGDAGEPEGARRLQVDPVEAGGQVVGHVAADEVAEGLGPRDRRACPTCRKSPMAARSSWTLASPIRDPPTLTTRTRTRSSAAARRSPSSRSCSRVRRIVSSADTGSAGGPSAMPSVRSSSRISGPVLRCRMRTSDAASLASAMRLAYVGRRSKEVFRT